MSRQTLLGLSLLAALASLVACDAKDVPVFSADVNAAGIGGGAGSAGSPGSAGVQSGAAGMTGGDTGGGGASAGRGGDTAAGGGDTVCHANVDCPDTFFCQTQSCAPGALGVCVLRQVLCDANLRPVCGCDHITYWNDCLREEYGVSASTEGACGQGAKTCRGNNDCQGTSGATCAHLLPPGVGCGTLADQGTCWVTPDCSMTGDTRQWQSCPPPGSGGVPGPCTSTCEAVKVGHPFIQADTASCP